MAVAAKTSPVSENEQVTLTAPLKFAIKVDHVDNHTVTASLVADQSLAALPSGEIVTAVSHRRKSTATAAEGSGVHVKAEARQKLVRNSDEPALFVFPAHHNQERET
jgi:hypothetical protein